MNVLCHHSSRPASRFWAKSVADVRIHVHVRSVHQINTIRHGSPYFIDGFPDGFWSAWEVEEQRFPAQSAHLSGENGRRYEGEGNASHLFAEPGHHPVANRFGGFRRNVSWCGASAAGGDDNMAAFLVNEFDESGFNGMAFIRHTPIEGRPRALDGLLEEPEDGGPSFVGIFSLAGSVTDRYNAQTNRVANVAAYP